MTSEDKTLPLPDWTPRQVVAATLVVLAVIAGFLLLVELQEVVFSLFVAIVISTAIGPAVTGLNNRGVPRSLGVVLMYLAALLLFVGAVWLILPLLAEQGANIAATSGRFYVSLLNTLRLSPSRIIRRLALQLPEGVPSAPPVPDPAAEEDPTTALEAVQQVLGYAGIALDGAFVFLAVLLLAFFWTLERDRIIRSLLLLVPQQRRDGVRDLFVDIEDKVGGYIRGIVILSFLVGGLAVVAYLLIGMPYALLLGLLAGLFEVVPLIGPPLGALPAVLVALAFDPSKVIWVLVAVALIQGLENALLVPRVMGRTVGVNAVVSLLALAAFSTLFGLAGALMAIPLAAVIQLLLDRYVLGPEAAEPEKPAGRDRVSVLRYETQQLVQDARNQLRHKPLELDDESDRMEDAIEALAADLDSLLAQPAANEGKAA